MPEIHDQIRSLIAAYTLGAVPEEEIPAIRAHILSCEECFAEAESYTEALAELASTVAPVAVSRGFTDRVVQEARDLTPRPRAAVRAGRWLRTFVPALVMITVVALLATSVALVGALDRQHVYERVVATLVRDPNALALDGPGGAEGVLASAEGGLLLVAVELGEAPRGRDYQLWLMKDGSATPSVTFDVSGSIVIVESPDDLKGYEGAAITVEPEGGSAQPTTDPVLST